MLAHLHAAIDKLGIKYPEDYEKAPNPSGYGEHPAPTEYVYHVSPYAKEILEGGFKIDPDKTTLGAFGKAFSISTTDYDSAKVYAKSIRLVVGALNGELGFHTILSELLALETSWEMITASAAAVMGSEADKFIQSVFKFHEERHNEDPNYDALTELKKSYDTIFEGLNNKYSGSNNNEILLTEDGFELVVKLMENNLDWGKQPLSDDARAQRIWEFLKNIHYTKLPALIGQLPQHLRSRNIEDVGIVEAVVAPVEHYDHEGRPSAKWDEQSKSYVYTEDPKGKYTWESGEKEWRFYDTTDLWPVRIVGKAVTHLTAALRLLAEDYEVSLELLCADDFGDPAHADVYEETKEKQIQVEERLAHVPSMQVSVTDTSDKYSRHQDAYVRFNWHQVRTVVSVLNEVGITGDILDVPANFPPELEQQAIGYGWKVERH